MKKQVLILSLILFVSLFLLVLGNPATQISINPVINLTSPTNWVRFNETKDNQTREIWNETFSGNITFYISIPKNSNVIDAKLNLNGYRENTTGSCSATTCSAPNPGETYYWSCSYYVDAYGANVGRSDRDWTFGLGAKAGSSTCQDCTYANSCNAPSLIEKSVSCTGSSVSCSKGESITAGTYSWSCSYTSGTSTGGVYYSTTDGTCGGTKTTYTKSITYTTQMSWTYWWNTTNPYLDVANSELPWEFEWKSCTAPAGYDSFTLYDAFGCSYDVIGYDLPADSFYVSSYNNYGLLDYQSKLFDKVDGDASDSAWWGGDNTKTNVYAEIVGNLTFFSPVKFPEDVERIEIKVNNIIEQQNCSNITYSLQIWNVNSNSWEVLDSKTDWNRTPVPYTYSPLDANLTDFSNYNIGNGIKVRFYISQNSVCLENLVTIGEMWFYVTYSPEFKSSRVVDLNTTLINEFLKICTPDENNNCNLPIKLHSDTTGKIQVSDINITYDYNFSELYSIEKDAYEPIIAGVSNITRYFNLNTSGKNSPLNISLAGYYLPFDGKAPVSCEINGNLYTPTIVGNYVLCPYNEFIEKGTKYSNKTIKWHKEVLITKAQTQHKFYDSKLQVDKTHLAYFNLTGSNLDTVGWSNVFIAGEIPYPEIYTNATPYTFIRDLTAGESYAYNYINISGIPIKETSYSLTKKPIGEYTQYDWLHIVTVRDGNASNYPIVYEIPLSRLADWNIRDATFDEVRVRGKTTGFTWTIDDVKKVVRIEIPTTFGTSSLPLGDSEVEVIYYVKTGAITGGGAGTMPLGEFRVKPLSILINLYDLCNSTTLELEWTGVSKYKVRINVSGEIAPFVEIPQVVEVEQYKITKVPVKVCIPETLAQIPVITKGWSGTIELTLKTEVSVETKKIPVEIRRWQLITPPVPTPVPKVIEIPPVPIWKYVVAGFLILILIGLIFGKI